MALMKCPECGGEMSTNAANCPHCGSPVTICPDCGKIHAGQPEICDGCGYTFKQKAPAAAPQPAKRPLSSIPTGTEGAPVQWRDGVKSDAATAKKLKTAARILNFADLAIYVIAGILVGIWTQGTELERLADYNSTLGGIKTCIVFGCIVYILNRLLEFGQEKIFELKFAKILAEHNIDCTDYLKAHANDVGDIDAQQEYRVITCGTFINKHRKEKTTLYIGFALKFILATLAGILLGVCLVKNFEILMTLVILGQDIGWSDPDWVWIGVALAFMIISSIYDYVFNSYFNKHLQNWFKQEISAQGFKMK